MTGKPMPPSLSQPVGEEALRSAWNSDWWENHNAPSPELTSERVWLRLSAHARTSSGNRTVVGTGLGSGGRKFSGANGRTVSSTCPRNPTSQDAPLMAMHSAKLQVFACTC